MGRLAVVMAENKLHGLDAAEIFGVHDMLAAGPRGLAGVQAARAARGQPALLPEPETAHGALLGHLREASPKGFQPMNVNYGLFPPLEGPSRIGAREVGARARRPKKREKNERLALRALEALEPYRWAVAAEAPRP